jgi:hypothetical protein
MARQKDRLKSVEERLLPYVTELGKYQDMLVDIGKELSNIRNNISKDSADDLEHQLKLDRLEHMFSRISLTYIMIGYDTEMLSMLGMVRDEHKGQCCNASHSYMTNTCKLMSMNQTYWETLSVSVFNEDIKKLVQKILTIINNIYPLYKKCLEMLKSEESILKAGKP